MGESLSPVEVLVAKCRQVSEAIAGHREAIAGLAAERDGMVGELRRLGLSERAVGRLLGISGPRVNQIMAVAPDPFEEHGFGRNAAPEPPRVPEMPVAAPRRRAAAPRTVTPAAAGVPAAAFQEPARVPLDPTGQPCAHPKGRRSKGLCGACGTHVGVS